MSVTTSHLTTLLLAAGIAATALGCRGGLSEDPPLHLVSDMDQQDHKKAQSGSKVFKDKRAMRPIDPKTVAHGKTDAQRTQYLKEDDMFFRGQHPSGKLVQRAPVQVTAELLARGEERYGIYCAPCHDKTGSGNGIVMQRSAGAFAGIPPFTLQRLVDAPDGELFQTITKGKSRMPGYAAQLNESDRWAVVTYLRVLQTSQAGKLGDLSEDEKRKLAPANQEAP